MILSKKVRLIPTKKQEIQLHKSAETAIFIYNWTLTKQEENKKNGGKFISSDILRKEITQLKKRELSWLFEVSNNVSKQAVKDACADYEKFFLYGQEKTQFKSKEDSKKSFYNDYLKLKIKENQTVLLEKVGWVKTSEQLPVNLKYENPRINFDGESWYLSDGIGSGDSIIG